MNYPAWTWFIPNPRPRDGAADDAAAPPPAIAEPGVKAPHALVRRARRLPARRRLHAARRPFTAHL